MATPDHQATDAKGSTHGDMLAHRIDMNEIHLQMQCPLYGKIPAEIRHIILEHVVRKYQVSIGIGYGDMPYFAIYPGSYLPHYHFARRIDLDILLSCRRLYMEYYLLPLTVNKHVCGQREDGSPVSSFHRMMAEQLRAVQSVHLVPEKSGHLVGLGSFIPSPVRPRKVTLTLGCRVWVIPGYGMAPQNVFVLVATENLFLRKLNRLFTAVQGLRELEIRFESSEGLRDKLNKAIDHVSELKFVTGDNLQMVLDQSSRSESRWPDAPAICSHECNCKKYLNPDMVRRAVDEEAARETTVPNWVRVREIAADMAEQRQMEGFIVVSLTWRIKTEQSEAE